MLLNVLPKNRNKSKLEPKVLFKIKKQYNMISTIFNASILNMGNT
jgi:hypothetical protein